jgi:hypothetical protein
MGWECVYMCWIIRIAVPGDGAHNGKVTNLSLLFHRAFLALKRFEVAQFALGSTVDPTAHCDSVAFSWQDAPDVVLATLLNKKPRFVSVDALNSGKIEQIG